MISGYLNGAIGFIVVLCGVVFVTTMAIGQRTQRGSATDRKALILSAVTVLLFVVGTWPLAQKNGSLITLIAALFSLSLVFALLGGLMAGRQRQKGVPIWNVATFLTFLMIALSLGYIHSRVVTVAIAAEQLGIDKQPQKIDPVADKDCPENLKSLYLAFEKYAEDTGSLPAADKWLDDSELTSKIIKDEWEHCPAVSNRHDDKFGYAYNIAVAGKMLNGKKLKDLPDAANTPLLYDSTDTAKSAHDAVTSLPKPGRHGGTNNILYCDGTVKAVAPK